MESAKTPTDEDLDERAWAALAQGDARALTELYDRHAGVLVGVAHRLLGNRADAEDLVHDVFVEAWGRARDFDARRGTVRRWLLVRLRSRAIDRLRNLATVDRRRRQEASEVAGDWQSSSGVASWDQSDARKIHAALETLSEEQRTVIDLAYFEGLSHAELALRIGAPVGTVKSRLFAAMARLRRGLEAPQGRN